LVHREKLPSEKQEITCMRDDICGSAALNESVGSFSPATISLVWAADAEEAVLRPADLSVDALVADWEREQQARERHASFRIVRPEAVDSIRSAA
jgi:hypothetical protein